MYNTWRTRLPIKCAKARSRFVDFSRRLYSCTRTSWRIFYRHFFFFRKCRAWSIQIVREKGRTDKEGTREERKRERERTNASRKQDRFSTYPRISWIDSSSFFCRFERSDEQIVRKSWNALFIREMRAARRLINMSLLFRRSSSAF